MQTCRSQNQRARRRRVCSQILLNTFPANLLVQAFRPFMETSDELAERSKTPRAIEQDLPAQTPCEHHLLKTISITNNITSLPPVCGRERGTPRGTEGARFTYTRTSQGNFPYLCGRLGPKANNLVVKAFCRDGPLEPDASRIRRRYTHRFLPESTEHWYGTGSRRRRCRRSRIRGRH